jgi:hypothetical protein
MPHEPGAPSRVDDRARALASARSRSDRYAALKRAAAAAAGAGADITPCLPAIARHMSDGYAHLAYDALRAATKRGVDVLSYPRDGGFPIWEILKSLWSDGLDADDLALLATVAEHHPHQLPYYETELRTYADRFAAPDALAPETREALHTCLAALPAGNRATRTGGTKKKKKAKTKTKAKANRRPTAPNKARTNTR